MTKLNKFLSKNWNDKKIYIAIFVIILLSITENFGFTLLYFLLYIIASFLVTAAVALIIKSIKFCYKKTQGKIIYQSMLTLILVSITIFLLPSFITNQFKPGFHFEKYNTPEEAKEALLKLHPIRSDIDGLARELKEIGCIEDNPYEYHERLGEDIKKPDNMDYFFYKHNVITSLFPRRWTVSIKTERNKIVDIRLQYQQGT